MSNKRYSEEEEVSFGNFFWISRTDVGSVNKPFALKFDPTKTYSKYNNYIYVLIMHKITQV